ncbi:hypothetical protein E3H11_43670, partial [Bradyrhizobium brasilense]|uniref:hypothetical protein n=1 Tax=Bradyrhizobium brasilense TaxID=1419277 RepID=UPI001697A6F9
SEAIRSIKVNADLNVTKPSKILGLTSALPNEGKSTLAFVFAQHAEPEPGDQAAERREREHDQGLRMALAERTRSAGDHPRLA